MKLETGQDGGEDINTASDFVAETLVRKETP